MAGAADGVSYLYKNVGLQIVPANAQPAVSYLYKNVGVAPRWAPIIGRVEADLNPSYGVGYLYKNVQ